MPTVDFVKTLQPKMLAAAVFIACLLFLHCVIFTHTLVIASGDAARWDDVNLPAQGVSGGWVLADGSDINYLTASPDGTLYAACNGLTDALYRSDDNGASWLSVGTVRDDIVGVAACPSNSGMVY